MEQRQTMLPSDHPKMLAFQTALTAMLKQRLDREEEKIRSVTKETEAFKRERMAKQRILLQAQAKLKQEEEKAEAARLELEEANRKRLAKELEAKKEEEALEETKLKLANLLLERDRLREKLNRVLEVQLALEARRVEAAGEAAASHTGLNKAQEDFKSLQERKRLQDVYVERMRRQAEELEQRAVEYQEQSANLKRKTSELRATVREADAETEKVRREKADVVNKWSAEVINIAKRDQVSFFYLVQ